MPCSARKIKLPAEALQGKNLSRAAQARVADQWCERLRQAHPYSCLARNLYLGRSFRKACKAADEAGAPLFIFSAGLGLITGAAVVPPYDLTLSPGAPGTLSKRIRGAFVPAAWWERMQAGGFASPVTALGARNGRILVGLTRPYAALVGSALASLPPEMLGRLRIFGGGLAQRLPANLHPQLLHYDARLDVLSPGTRLDGAARSVEHFAQLAAAMPLSTVAADQVLIESSLSQVVAHPAIKRPRVTDASLLSYIRPLVREGISATSALKQLRSQALVACEERRFRRLYKEAVA
ncbi:DUF6884 domain-containing protein [Lysobacter enzymogenes]|uniref:DUF6884 domain-containing protein n=1 Tax=Lysobacter enzymogenes TaxID=69 RepID=UPI00374886F5